VNADAFNRLYPVGTPVFAYPGFRPEDASDARRLVTRTRTAAQVSASGDPVVWVEGEGSYICLTHVDPVTEEQFAEARAEETAAAVAALGALPMPVGDEPQPLDDTRLAEIAARAEAATEGPWGFYDGDTYAAVAADLQMTGRASYSYRQKIAQLEDENYWDDPAHEDDDEERAAEQMAANARFVAHARTDVPALLAEIQRLKAERHSTNEALSDAAEALREMRDRLAEYEQPAADRPGMHPAIRTINPAGEA
jgi:uncharacterized small protein (DUF1192 family)